METAPDKTTDPRHQSRRVVLCALFAYTINKNSRNLNEILRYARETINFVDVAQEDKDLTKFLFRGITDNLDVIDEIIGDCAPEWPIDKIACVDLNCLRIAVFELTISYNAPTKVIIDESVELAKEFGNDTSGKFINGVLATVVKLYRNK